MDNNNSEDINRELYLVCKEYQDERVSGQWFISQTGLNKVAKLLGGNYSRLTKNQRGIFRQDCVNHCQSGYGVKSWWYYLNK